MGYWGDQPKDGDAPNDIFRDITVDVSRNLKELYSKMGKRGSTWDAFELAGAVQICALAGISLDPRITDIAESDLEAILGDDGFMDSWKDPSRARSGIRKAISDIRKASGH